MEVAAMSNTIMDMTKPHNGNFLLLCRLYERLSIYLFYTSIYSYITMAQWRHYASNLESRKSL